MANKALATRQRMQFRVEPSQAPAKGRGNFAKRPLPSYLGSNAAAKKQAAVSHAKSVASLGRVDV